MMKWMTTGIFVLTGLAGIGFATLTLARDGLAERPGAGERPSFAELDADDDGVLTAADFRALQAERFGGWDSDGNGTLDRDELLAMLTRRAEERAAAMADRMLAWGDSDGDGAIGPDELPGQPAGRMAMRLDSDGDGQITEAEFDAARDRMADRRGDRGRDRRGRFGRH